MTNTNKQISQREKREQSSLADLTNHHYMSVLGSYNLIGGGMGKTGIDYGENLYDNSQNSESIQNIKQTEVEHGMNNGMRMHDIQSYINNPAWTTNKIKEITYSAMQQISLEGLYNAIKTINPHFKMKLDDSIKGKSLRDLVETGATEIPKEFNENFNLLRNTYEGFLASNAYITAQTNQANSVAEALNEKYHPTPKEKDKE